LLVVAVDRCDDDADGPLVSTTGGGIARTSRTAGC
jgi:hypothetical protein